jgi:hypothetical protein
MELDDDTMTIEHLLRRVPEGEETIFDLLAEGGDKVKTIEIKRRKLQPELPQQLPEPEIARCRARNHVFNDIDTFAGFLNREAENEGSVVLADVDERTITAVLDENDESDNEQVTLRAIEHPLFTPWGRLLNQAIPVIDFSLFVMQHRRAVIDPDGRELAMLFSQVKMSKAVSIFSGVGKKTLNGVMVDVEIAGERKGMAVELPESIVINVPLFVGTSPQRIEIDLLVTNKGEYVVVYATAADVEQQRIIAFEEMVAKLKESTGMLVGLGKVQHRDWRTVPLSK